MYYDRTTNKQTDMTPEERKKVLDDAMAQLEHLAEKYNKAAEIDAKLRDEEEGGFHEFENVSFEGFSLEEDEEITEEEDLCEKLAESGYSMTPEALKAIPEDISNLVLNYQQGGGDASLIPTVIVSVAHAFAERTNETTETLLQLALEIHQTVND